MQRCLAVIRDNFERQLAKYFEKWRHFSVEHSKAVLEKAKVAMVNLTRLIFKKYFWLWKLQNIKRKRRKTIMEIEENVQIKFETQNSISQTIQKNNQIVAMSKSKSNQRIKKIVHNIYIKNMRSRFQQWQYVLDRHSIT